MKWELPTLTHRHLFLDKRKVSLLPKFLYLIYKLYKHKAELIITLGFNLNMLSGYFFTRFYKRSTQYLQIHVYIL